MSECKTYAEFLLHMGIGTSSGEIYCANSAKTWSAAALHTVYLTIEKTFGGEKVKLINRLTGTIEANGNREECLRQGRELMRYGEKTDNLYLIGDAGVKPFAWLLEKQK